jgi:predicted phage terminase large subunit-like protein
MLEIRPQPGPQENFLQNSADIVIYGGAAGGGKTFSLLLESLRHTGNPEFGAVLFRRTTPQITNEGGMWDASAKIYSPVGATPKESTHEWVFPSGARIKMAHLEYDKNRLDWQGSEVPLFGFDELSHFTSQQFWYMLSRNRSTCGIKPYIRATTNPDPDSFVAELIAWWLDPATGFAIPERSGVVRWFVRENDIVIWGDSKEELLKANPTREPKSFTFIHSSVFDNRILLEKDPGYLANLKALPYVERARLLDGNWKVRPAAGNYFKKEFFEVVDALPAYRTSVRYWDRAGSEKKADGSNKPDWTVGVKMGMDKKGVFYVEDVVRFQGSPLTVEKAVRNTATQDGTTVQIGIEQDPGQAGKAEAEYQVRNLAGYRATVFPVTKDKTTRAGPFSAQVEIGNVKVLRAAWNSDYFTELENFPEGDNDDQVDASSGAFMMLANKPHGNVASAWPGANPAPANDWE